jgi:hypothetical protein
MSRTHPTGRGQSAMRLARFQTFPNRRELIARISAPEFPL